MFYEKCFLLLKKSNASEFASFFKMLPFSQKFNRFCFHIHGLNKQFSPKSLDKTYFFENLKTKSWKLVFMLLYALLFG